MMNGIDLLNQWSEIWSYYVIHCLIDSALIFVLIGALWCTIKKHVSAKFGYFLFVIVLAKLAIPGQFSAPSLLMSFIPLSGINTSDESSGQFPFGLYFQKGSTDSSQSKTTDDAQNEEASQIPDQSKLTVFSYFMLGWLVWIVICIIRLKCIANRTHWLLQNTTLLDRTKLPVDLEGLRQTAGVKHPVRWMTASWVKSPVAFGYFKPVIVVPPDMFERFTPNQLRWILLHELSHISGFDAVVIFLQRIFHILFFFNPVVWWTNANIDRLREYACDDDALVNSQSARSDCGEGFLAIALQANGLPTFLPAGMGIIDYETMIRRRLMRILDIQRTLQPRVSLGASMFLIALVLFLMPLSGKLSIAQVSGWVKVADEGPPGRVFGNMVYDSERGVVVLHGGLGDTVNLNFNDTWEWDGNTWTLVSEKGPLCIAAPMAFDPERGVSVLFGGSTFDNFVYTTVDPYTWEWDGNTWKRLDTTYMQGRAGARMVYDSDRKVMVMHGGGINSVFTGETWEWDGEVWIQLPDGPARNGHNLVYDNVRKKVILYGGWEAVKGEYPEESTWEFDGSTWTPIPTSIEPPKRWWSSLAFDSSRGVAVLFGGGILSGSGPFPGEERLLYPNTWEWNGDEWKQIDTPNPPARYGASIVFDSKRNKMVMFGGSPDEKTGFTGTWEYSAPSSGIAKSMWSLY